jgi:hypothetical protein
MELPPPPPAVEMKPRVVKHITEMTEEEREKVLGKCEKARASYMECMREDGYNCKRDRCKEMREAKEREEKEKADRLLVLQQRNEILEDHARIIEKQLNEYKVTTDIKIEKLAGLLSQLISK